MYSPTFFVQLQYRPPQDDPAVAEQQLAEKLAMPMILRIMLIVHVVAVGVWSDDSVKPVDFAHDVVPVLKKHCVGCHGGTESKGGFSLNTKELVLDAEAVVVGQARKSRLIELVSSKDPKSQMPPKGRARLSEKEIASLSRWIDEGLDWDADFTFANARYEPVLKPRQVQLPPIVNGRANPIDRIVDQHFAEHKLSFPGANTDREFLRRTQLDLVGLLPTSEQLDGFLARAEPNKRETLVQELLNDDIAYAEHWLTFWNDLLRNDYAGTGFITGGRKQITGWLYRSLVENKPYNRFVEELIVPTAESEGFIQGILWRGNVNASQALEIQFAQNISQAFLGINMKCASCHDSFIDHWKVAEAYGLAAIYSTRKLEIHRCDKPTGKIAEAAWVFPELGQIDPAADQRTRLKQLSDLMTHRDNGRFTRTIVNRIWHRLMGRGIVHPVDAMGTRPWNEDLLDFLAEHLVDSGYNLKATIELICTSQIYQAQIASRKDSLEGNKFVFQGPIARRLSAEQFVDAVWQVTQSAPIKSDAQVLRLKPVEKLPNAKQQEIVGRWIWSYPEAGSAMPKAGESITVRKEFQLEQVPDRAFAAVTCDNEYSLFVNGKLVASDKVWEDVETVVFTQHVQPGKNTLLIVARNDGDSPNPAGLFFEAGFRTGDAVTHFGTDADWEWTSTVPDQAGKFKEAPTDWKPAAIISTPLWHAKVATQISQSIEQGTHSPLLMVRASLLKNDPLMKALGRPNRDQIVTMRPDQFTTLEAIDLANGQILADAISSGSHRIVNSKRFANPPELTQWLFQSTLCRNPTEQELALASDLVGTELNTAGVEDLLWAVLMLPEFHLVR